jgi:glycerol-3-phosphate acyltransferase PlsY
VDFAPYIATGVGAYLLGSVPTGYLVGRARGIDIRSVGSGNIGATNVFRALGKGLGILVLVIDGLKGFAACAWAVDLMLRAYPGLHSQEEALRVVAGLAAVVGHNFTCWLRFKGGKGIATSAGVLAALVPWSLVVIACVWVVLFAASRYVSLASISASATLPVAAWMTHESLTMILITSAMAALAIYKHRSNIRRLLEGTENRIDFHRRTKVT